MPKSKEYLEWEKMMQEHPDKQVFVQTTKECLQQLFKHIHPQARFANMKLLDKDIKNIELDKGIIVYTGELSNGKEKANV